MEPGLQPAQHRATFSGVTGLIVAVAVVGILLIAFPAYRWFFLISLGIGLVWRAFFFCGIGSGRSGKKMSTTNGRSGWDRFAA
jgi:hypothetical protein